MKRGLLSKREPGKMNTVEPLRNGHLGDKKVAGVGRFKQESSMDCPSGRYIRRSTVYDFGIYWIRGIKRQINTKEIIRVEVMA